MKRPAMNTNAQFGLATLWRRARHRFTPTAIKAILASDRFQNRLHLWNLIHDLGSNTKARFDTTRILRSHEGGLHLCYALRRLATNIQEPYRTLSLQAIDNSITWWKGKPAPRASALRAPWAMSPNLAKTLQGVLRQWYLRMIQHHVPCHLPSFKTIFVKHSSVVDLLCNHKAAIESWSLDHHPQSCCANWSAFRSAALNPSSDHWVLSGSSLTPLLPPSVAVVAEGSLQNKVFPQKREFLSLLQRGILQWCRQNGLPSMPKSSIQRWVPSCGHPICPISPTTSPALPSNNWSNSSLARCSIVNISTPLLFESFARAYIIRPLKKTFLDPEVFVPIPHTPQYIISTLVDQLLQKYGRSYPWAIGKGRQLPSGYILAKKKKDFTSGRPIISFVDAPFRPMLNILARLLFQLIPIACPDHFATGDVYHLLHILRQAPEHGSLRLYNQDLAGFFTSIDQQRFLGAWSMLLDLLRPHMNVNDTEVFSVYPGRFNNPTDLIKGRTFRRLNVTRKILIKDIPSLLTTALNMQTFCLGQRCLSQLRGSPMGSPLSPALCAMVVSISEQIWATSFKSVLANHHLFVRHIRYVDNRLVLGDPQIQCLPGEGSKKTSRDQKKTNKDQKKTNRDQKKNKMEKP